LHRATNPLAVLARLIFFFAIPFILDGCSSTE
jgi:hypothetical protein